MAKQKTEAEMLQELEQLDPKPQYPTEAGERYNAQQGGGLPVNAPPEFSRGVPASTTPRQLTEAEMLRELEQLDPRPAFGADEKPRDVLPYEVLPSLMSNIIPSAGKQLRGAVDAIWNWRDSIPAMAQMIPGIPMALAGKAIPAIPAMAENNPIAKPFMDAGNAVVQDNIDTYGSPQAIMNTLARDPMRPVMDGLGFVPGGQAVNVTRVMNPAARVAGHVTRAAANNARPGLNTLRQIADGQEQPLINSLLADQEIVPGAPHNAGQAVVRSNTNAAGQTVPGVTLPAFQAATKRAGEMHSRRSAIQKQTQSAARSVDIGNIGRNHTLSQEQLDRMGNPTFNPSTATIDELEAALDAADAANYAPVDSAMLTFDDQLLDLMQTPVMRDIMSQAQTSTANARRPLLVGDNVPASPGTPPTSVPSGLFDHLGRPIMTTIPGTPPTPAQYAQIGGNNLDFFKKAFDDALSKEAREVGADSQKAQDILTAREQFLAWVEDPSRLPEYNTARSDSHAWRQLIARRRAAEVFGEALNGPLEGENQISQRYAILRNLMDSPRNAVKGNAAVDKATPFDAYDNWSDLLSPEDMTILNRNLDDLARAKLAEEQAREGGFHSRDINNSANPAPQIPNNLNPIIGPVNALIRGVAGQASDRIGNNLATALHDPAAAAAMLQQVVDWQGNLDRYSTNINDGTMHFGPPGRGMRGIAMDIGTSGIGQAGRAIRWVNGRPVIYNALTAEREERERRNALSRE